MRHQDQIELGNVKLDLQRTVRLLERVRSRNPLTHEELTQVRDTLNSSAETVQTIRDRTFE